MTDRGLVRDSNQDRFLIAPLSAPDAPGGPVGHLFAVADGVGGAIGGGVASALVVRSIAETSIPALRRLCEGAAPDPRRMLDELRALFRGADARLAEQVADNPDLSGMATTLTVAVSVGRTLFVAHAGDSRCYVLRGGKLRRLTRDHTVALEMARLGLISAEHVADHPFRHVLSNFVGIGPSRLEVEVHEAELSPGDGLLLCSDGLTGMMASHDIARILVAAPSPDIACRDLIARANELGGYDNVTAVFARASLEA